MKHKHLIIISMLVITSLYSLTYKPGNPARGMSPLIIPNQIETWNRVKDLTVSDTAYQALDPDALIIREYRNDTDHTLSLSIIYHQNARWGAHNPQVCYKSQGWRILNSKRTAINGLPHKTFEINQFTVTQKGRSHLISYWWYTSGKRQMASRLKHMLYMCLNGVIRGHIESGFVSISIPVSAYGERVSNEIITDFCRAFVPILELTIS